jgi:TolB protein
VTDVGRSGTGRKSVTEGYAPNWFPDGSRIAFHRSANGSVSRIYVADADGTDVRRLTNNPGDERSPDWQPVR